MDDKIRQLLWPCSCKRIKALQKFKSHWHIYYFGDLFSFLSKYIWLQVRDVKLKLASKYKLIYDLGLRSYKMKLTLPAALLDTFKTTRRVIVKSNVMHPWTHWEEFIWIWRLWHKVRFVTGLVDLIFKLLRPFAPPGKLQAKFVNWNLKPFTNFVFNCAICF